MKNRILIYLNRIFSISLILLLLTCSGPQKSNINELQVLLKILEEFSLNEEENEKDFYVNVSEINRNFYDVLFYKEKTPQDKLSPDKSINNTQMIFSIDNEKDSDWKSMPVSGKIKLKKNDNILLFSLGGFALIGEVNNLKKTSDNPKVTLTSIMGSEKKVNNFKYLVLSLASSKKGKLKITSNDLEKLKDTEIDFDKGYEEFTKDEKIQKILKDKKTATKDEVFNYEVDESIIIDNMKKKLATILPSDIKKLDGITADVTSYPSTITHPNFLANPYEINNLSEVKVSYVTGSIERDNLEGSLSYEVELSVSRIEEKRKIKIAYLQSFKSSKEKQNKLNSISMDDIKKLDGITVDKTKSAFDIADPEFKNNPYNINGLDVQLTFQSRTSKTSKYYRELYAFSGSFYYKVKISAPDLKEKTIEVSYHGFRSWALDVRKFKSISESDIKDLDGITADVTSYPPTTFPNFLANPYEINNLSGVKVTYVTDSIESDKLQGSLSYKVEIIFSDLYKLSSSLEYFPYARGDTYKKTITVFYPIESFKHKVERTKLTGHLREIYSVDISPDNTKIVSGGVDAMIKIWKVSDGSLINTLPEERKSDGWPDRIYNVKFLPDSKKIVSSDLKLEIKIWDSSIISTSNTPVAYIRKMSSVDGVPQALDSSSDGSKIVAGLYNSKEYLKIWNANDGSVLKNLAVSTGRIYTNSIKFFPTDDTKVIFSSSNRKIRIWDTNTDSVKKTDTNLFVYEFDISSDESQVAVVGYDTQIHIYNIRNGALVESKLIGEDDSDDTVSYTLNAVKFSPDGTKVITGSENKTIEIWNVADGSLVKTLHQDGQVRSLDISSDGKTIVSSDLTTIYIWKNKDGSSILD